MIDLTGVTHHPVIEELTDVLCNKTQNTDRGFFRTEVAYFLGKMAASMRATIITKDRGEIPVNIYALALATSGFGKGHSVNVVENEFMAGFHQRFTEETFQVIAEKHLWEQANARALRNSSDANDEFEAVQAEYKRCGTYVFTFDSGTPPAIKQLRNKMILAKCGAINLQIDEIGSNLIGSVDVLTLFLELYDQGLVKQKLTKNTAENTRGEEVNGKTPTNMLLFGTPSKLLDGSTTEDQFYSFLETGYARRCLFGWGNQERKAGHSMTPEEIYKKLTAPSNDANVKKWAAHFEKLADPGMYGWKMMVEEPVGIKLIQYKIACEAAAELMPEHEEVKKAELGHRYWKALKLAGALAFVDESPEIEMDHLLSAILLVEECGKAFEKILNREKNYVKLAKYIATCGKEVTHADLNENLPYYKTGQAARNEMMTLAIAYGYKHHIIIKKSFADGIELYKGETLQETNIDEMSFSYSDNWAYEYQGEQQPFSELHNLMLADDGKGGPMHWANHHFKNRHRAEENVVPGFNLLVLDIDGGVSLDVVHELMKDYKFMTYTTKRHQVPVEKDGQMVAFDRFRLILPINYHLELSSDEYKELMNNIMQWLPFPTDEAANQRSKKWETNPKGAYHYNLDGEILDVLPFIPKTAKNEQHTAEMQKIASMDNLERWFAQRMASGNRNNNLLKYAMALVDSGMGLYEVQQAVIAFNGKLSNGLTEDEIRQTILVSVSKRYSTKS
ncbi:primase C-terminal domain-containing protein [Caballeronia sp. LZ034LL]|uniref:primase C-terminal domain-containing protein n=1 Tax=Caballeronia sp. LZ034LL TaxID=3038567 RepID=UPI002856C9E2|nr:primase C-terminal domain-containing protein [Caballeronia sp. LZ034LL]MDR5839307.1 primase C-terminal domain-containing protein [Caballeronia sp. LZ034LL]